MIHEVTGGDQARFERFAGSAPLGRAAGPEEIANLALYLASDESAFSTGSEFVADGGDHRPLSSGRERPMAELDLVVRNGTVVTGGVESTDRRWGG